MLDEFFFMSILFIIKIMGIRAYSPVSTDSEYLK